MTDKIPPLVTPELVAKMKAELSKMEQFKPELEKAKSAGLDVDSQLKKLQDNIDAAKKFLAVYGR